MSTTATDLRQEKYRSPNSKLARFGAPNATFFDNGVDRGAWLLFIQWNGVALRCCGGPDGASNYRSSPASLPVTPDEELLLSSPAKALDGCLSVGDQNLLFDN